MARQDQEAMRKASRRAEQWLRDNGLWEVELEAQEEIKRRVREATMTNVIHLSNYRSKPKSDRSLLAALIILLIAATWFR